MNGAPLGEITVILYGRLGQRKNHKISVRTAKPLNLESLLSQLGIPREQVQVIMVNHRAVPPRSTVSSGDRVALFPKEYPFFPDWSALRASTSA